MNENSWVVQGVVQVLVKELNVLAQKVNQAEAQASHQVKAQVQSHQVHQADRLADHLRVLVKELHVLAHVLAAQFLVQAYQLFLALKYQFQLWV